MNDIQLIELIKKISDETYNHWVLNKSDEDKNSNPKNLKEAFQQTILVLEHIGNINAELSQEDREDLCNHGIQLHLETIIWIEKLNIKSIEHDAKTSLIYYAAWAGRIGAKLDDMDKIVNILGEYANHCKDEKELEELAYASICIIRAVPLKLKAENKADDSRPWRVLLLNNGIVATRSNRVDYIEKAYELIGEHIPEDAPTFFKQAVSQIDTAGYSDDVKDVVNHHFDLWNDETLH